MHHQADSEFREEDAAAIAVIGPKLVKGQDSRITNVMRKAMMSGSLLLISPCTLSLNIENGHIIHKPLQGELRNVGVPASPMPQVQCPASWFLAGILMS